MAPRTRAGAKLGRKRQADSGPTKGPGWDIDYAKPVKNGPLARGFTHDFLYPASLDMPPYVYLRDDMPVGIPTVTKAFKEPNRPGPATADFEASTCLADFAREARAFIGRLRRKEGPVLPLPAPHQPPHPDRPSGASGRENPASATTATS